MTQIHELTSIQELDTALKAASTGTTLLFKHSSTCDLSAAAWEELLDFLRDNTTPVNAYFVVVQNARPVSNEIESRTGIRHESPQAFLFKNGELVWNASHRRITTKVLHEIVEGSGGRSSIT
jgi:bacillithiol system protein YtxJ